MHPFFHLFSVDIPAYGVFMAAGICVASSMAIIRAKKSGGDPDYTLIIICCAIGGALLGSYLLYLFASYGLNNVIEDIKDGSFAFAKSGGLVFYGGLIGGIAGALLGIRVTHETRYSMLVNAIVPCIPLGHAIGRVGCLFAGCCYGIPYAGIGSIHLSSVGIMHPVFPVQLLESVLNLILSIYLMVYSRKKPPNYTLLYLYLICYSGMRFILEFLRGDQIRGVFIGLSTSQWISLLMTILGIMLLFFAHTLRKAGNGE